MKTSRSKIPSLYNVSYFFFVSLIVIVPLALYRGFDNSLEFVKLEVLKIIGGLFIITSSLYFIQSLNERSSQRNKTVFDKSLDPFVILFVLSAVLSTLFSIDVHTSYSGSYERQVGLLLYLYLFIIYLLLPFIINSNDRIRLTLRFMEATAVLVALMCIVEYTGVSFVDLRPQGFKRPVTTVGHPIFSAGFMMLIFPFSVLNVSSKRNKLLKIAVPLVIAAGIIATQTRTALVALGAELILIAALYSLASKDNPADAKKKYTQFIVAISGVVLLFVLLVVLFPENAFIKRVLSITTFYDQPRWLLWRDSILMFTRYPFTGTGIGLFSRAFENFASYELRFSEIRVYFDNPHNNFINLLCTMGLLGAGSYLLLLFQVVRTSLKNLFSKKNSSSFRFYSLAFLAFISGYMIFGLADFDDINILLYLFVILVLLRAVNRNFAHGKNSQRALTLNRKTIFLSGSLFILFSIYNIYSSFDEITAQRYFSQGLERYSANDIDGFTNAVNNAINLKPDEPYYRYIFASRTNIYCSGLTTNSAALKYRLLQEARQQVIKAELSNSSRLNCLALRSLIELGLGNEKEGFRLKDELFKIDSTQVSYRINLAVYYLNQDNYDAALKELNTVLAWDVKNINALTAKVMYHLRTGNNVEAEKTCREMLAIDPGNGFAQRTLKELAGKK